MNKQTEDKILEMLLHIYEKSVGAHPLDPPPDGVQWWIKCCGGSRLMRLQITPPPPCNSAQSAATRSGTELVCAAVQRGKTLNYVVMTMRL